MGKGNEFSIIYYRYQVVSSLCYCVFSESTSCKPASVSSASGGVSDGDLTERPPLIDWGSYVSPAP